MNENINAKGGQIGKIGDLRNQVCAHRWKGKIPQEVFAEASMRLNTMKEITDLARLVVCELVKDAGGVRSENIRNQWINESTLQCIANDAGQVMSAFVEPV